MSNYTFYDWTHRIIPSDVQYIWCDTPDVIGSPNKPEDNGRWFEAVGKSYTLSPAIILNRPKTCQDSLEKRPEVN